MASRNIASIDIGTNTARLLIAETGNGPLVRLYREQKITRLGNGMSANGGFLTTEAITRTIDAVKGFLSACKKYEVSGVKAVATSAARTSVNGEELVTRIGNETGIQTEIVSGEMEAYLTIRGILGTTNRMDSNCYILDIGGGSTEFSVVAGGEVKQITSLELGVLDLCGKYTLSDIPADDELNEMEREITSRVSAGIGHTKSEYGFSDYEMIATSGTPLTLACICAGMGEYDPERVEGYRLTKDDIRRLMDEITKYSPERRVHIYGALEPGREEIIIPGCLILLNIMRSVDLQNLTVSESSLLEGIILDY